eukprot:gene25654-30985_t
MPKRTFTLPASVSGSKEALPDSDPKPAVSGSPPKRSRSVGSNKKDAALPSSPIKDSAQSTQDAVEVDVSASPTKSKKDTLSERSPHPRDLVTPHPLHPEHQHVKIMTWNVNGLKALVTSKLHILTNMVQKHAPDVICLQETKIQESAVGEYKDLLEGYDSYWHCSTVKKGYSGTAVLVKRRVFAYDPSFAHSASTTTGSNVSADKAAGNSKKQAKLSSFFAKPAPTSAPATSTPAVQSSPETPLLRIQGIKYDFEDEDGGSKHKGEGRVITLETDKLFLVGCYVPNSGEGLVRLTYRIEEWDKHFFSYLRSLSQKKPVVMTGDLNVGHLDLDIHNPDAKHIVKQAGLTPQERNSFGQFLQAGDFRDAFRFYYPDAIGQFTYWSQRTFARPVNRGIRLDYFIASQKLFPGTQENDRGEVVTSGNEISDGKVSGAAKRRTVKHEDIPVPGVADCYILHEDTVGTSDHCPVMLVVRVM